MKNKVYLNRSFPCKREELFDYLSDPVLINQWFGPKDYYVGSIRSELKVGGTYRIELWKEGTFGFAISGIYTLIERPTRLQFEFRYESPKTVPDSVVTFSLEEKEHVTELRLVQEFSTEVPDFENRTKAWSFMLGRILELVD